MEHVRQDEQSVRHSEPTVEPLATIAAAVRRERERCGFSLTELARRAGVAKSTLSQLEAAQGNPSVETLWSLGTALGVPFSRLVDPPRPSIRVVRAGRGPRIGSDDGSYAATLLASCPMGARRDVYIITADPGSVRSATAHLPGSLEHVVVCSGRFLAGPSDGPVELGPGDYAVFPGDAPHLYEALDPGSRAVLVMEHV